MLLALHGYLASKESFLKQIKFFSAFYKVVAVDMTGFGESPKMERPYSVDDYKSEIKRIVNELGVEKYGSKYALVFVKIEVGVVAVLLYFDEQPHVFPLYDTHHVVDCFARSEIEAPHVVVFVVVEQCDACPYAHDGAPG